MVSDILQVTTYMTDKTTVAPSEMKVISNNNAEHYIWGDVCDGWHLAKSSNLSVIQERVPPGAKEVMHYHHHSEQFFYVLTGQATLLVNDEAHVLKQGEGMHVPAGVSHQMMNAHDVDVHFLVISTPPSHGDREVVAEK